jgi:hypothetical protein
MTFLFYSLHIHIQFFLHFLYIHLTYTSFIHITITFRAICINCNQQVIQTALFFLCPFLFFFTIAFHPFLQYFHFYLVFSSNNLQSILSLEPSYMLNTRTEKNSCVCICYRKHHIHFHQNYIPFIPLFPFFILPSFFFFFTVAAVVAMLCLNIIIKNNV